MLKRIVSTLLLFFLISACGSIPPAADSVSQSASTPKDWWRSAVFYEIFVRSFYDTNNDGIGEFNGITQKLDYLDSLGITAIWLMPIHPSPSYHGYDVTDYYAVNPEYGSMDDFNNLLDEAHKRGIRIIIDLVLNHTSSEHPWFIEAKSDPNSRYRNYYVWEEKDKGNGWHQGDHGYYFGLFWEGMPDLNYNNPAVTEDMLKVTDYWLNEIGVDGFRVDAVKHLIEANGKTENTPETHEWLEGFYKAYKTENPQAYTVGEVFNAGSSVVKSYTGDELDQIFNFEISSGIVNSVSGGANSGVNSAVKFALMDTPEFNFATFLTNHDQNRVMSVFRGNVDMAKVAAFLMLTFPGTPFIYYGEEIGMQGQKPDEDIRLPMQWDASEFAGFSIAEPWRTPHNDYAKVNVAAQTGDPASLLEHYRALIELRKDNLALQTGNITLLDAGNSGIFASLRSDVREIFLVLANLTGMEISEYGINLDGTALAESAFGVETVSEAEQARGRERGGQAVAYKPFESLSPFAMYVLKVNPQ